MVEYNENEGSIVGWMDVAEGRSKGKKYRVMKGLLHGFYAEGNYASDWSSVSLPSSPTSGRWYVRYNLDTSTLRIYIYTSGGWKYIE